MYQEYIQYGVQVWNAPGMPPMVLGFVCVCLYENCTFLDGRVLSRCPMREEKTQMTRRSDQNTHA